MRKKTFDNSARARAWARIRPPAKPAGPEPTITEPARPASFTADLLVPLGQAIVTGGMGAGVVVALALELGATWETSPIGVWAILALAIACMTWLVLLGQTRRLLWKVERWTGLDLDGDGTRGRPASSGDRIVFLNAKGDPQPAPGPPAEVPSLADFVSVLDVRGTDLRTWEKRMPRPIYQKYRDALIRAGWAAWRSVREDGTVNTGQGWELIKSVGWILKRIQYLDE